MRREGEEEEEGGGETWRKKRVREIKAKGSSNSKTSKIIWGRVT